jgi:GTP-binding protein
MTFIDHAKIFVQAGAGGNGCLSFRREKFVPRGGPDGGDGGAGGSVWLEVNGSVNTLLAFRYKHHFVAKRGRHGEGSDRHGRSGDDMVLKVPAGTTVLDEAGVRVLADLTEEGQRFLAARGGRGGRGNARFATSTNRAPRRHDPGERGEQRWLNLELKLLSDVGIIGFPNAGKSTLISRISAARPKIAGYPFTTLVPNLGVVDTGSTTFVVADIPGLIEGAHEGHGLGIQFLRHIERTRLLLHVVDLDPNTGRRPVEDLEVINSELGAYRRELLQRPQVVVANKMDIVQDPSQLEALAAHCLRTETPLLKISAVTGTGIPELITKVAAALGRIEERRAGEASTGGEW